MQSTCVISIAPYNKLKNYAPAARDATCRRARFEDR
jgi:hypothetical protein